MMKRLPILLVLSLFGLVAACSGGGPTDDDPPQDSGTRVPLTEMGTTRKYLGFEGGLYPGGANEPPAAHAEAGRQRGRAVRPLDAAGNPAPDGKYVLLSIGMSNTTQEFCSAGSSASCDPWTFAGQAAADPAVNRTSLVIANGARGGQTTATWDQPTDANYDRVRDSVLVRRGLSERQVQVAWVKLANAGPRVALPASGADAYLLEAGLGDVVRALRVRYPNLRQVFLASRIYAGYATTALNPEPYAYESGFAVKWLVQAQIDQARTGAVQDTRAGDLRYDAAAPWLAWGPYLWADGESPRSDGLVWQRADFEGDGTHPAASGERKVGTLLLQFFKTSPQTRCWFVAGATC